jgi:hypothetical protein
VKRASLSFAVIVLTVFILMGRHETHRPTRGAPQLAACDREGRYQSGTIYFRQLADSDELWSRQLLGGRTRRLPYGVNGEPSYSRHAGERWFLSTRRVPAADTPGGGRRLELFVVTEQGRAVQLTAGADLEVGPVTPRWCPGSSDRVISWVARRWSDGRVVEGGVYTAELAFDPAGMPIGLREKPRRPVFVRELIPQSELEWGPDPSPDIYGFDWSPDAGSLVFESSHRQLWIHDRTQGRTSRLADALATDPVWSPRGDRIAFRVAEAFGAIATVRPDGTDRRDVISIQSRDGMICFPGYSPGGDNLMYAMISRGDNDRLSSPMDMDVCLAAADGSHPVNATSDMQQQLIPIAWRADN